MTTIGGSTEGEADDLTAHLNESATRTDLDEEDRNAILRWQGMDRFYSRVQALERTEDPSDDDEAAEVRDVLSGIIDRCELERNVVSWRGERDAAAAFGAPSSELADLVGQTLKVRGFYASSASLRIVREQFTVPPRDPVVVRIFAPAGTQALWVAPSGAADQARQRELLMAEVSLYIVEVVIGNDGVPVVTVEVRS